MQIFLIIVIVLFILAISDLIVGVSNDSVNFLNSAIGSKVAPRYIIMIAASLGIIIGTTFSSGLMEVARKGIFNPQYFSLQEIMVIFLAVMITDVMLLDFYNTFALPTSTTVSVVFELLGAAVATSIIVLSKNSESYTELIKYINTSKAFAIISGILISIVISFTTGVVIQFFTRLIFTFNYQKRIKKFGSVWGSLALTAITFFIIVKGAKDSSLLSADAQVWIANNTDTIISVSLIAWIIILQLVLWFTRVDILKPIILIGTFALALAFAANDLVNFIGVPLAGMSSYILASNSADPANFAMAALNENVSTPTIILLIAGLIMVVTLSVNKKARSVTKTEVNLGRQLEGFERFESTMLSRIIVNISVAIFTFCLRLIPRRIRKFIANRYESPGYDQRDVSPPAFDLLRASVNLMVASILISFATSLKLPLSTTYVTFMVAMGTSLSDKAWGRDSAVYRVTGVLTVIGGWFFTAIIAFTVSGTLAVVIYYGKLPAVFILLLLVGYLIFRTHIHHRKSTGIEEDGEKAIRSLATDELEALKLITDEIKIFLEGVSKLLSQSFEGLLTADKNILKDAKRANKLQKKNSNNIVLDILNCVRRFPSGSSKTSRRYGKIIANIQGLYLTSQRINQFCFNHIDNNHTVPKGAQVDDFILIELKLSKFIENSVKIMADKNFENPELSDGSYNDFLETLSSLDENQLERIRKNSDTSRNSMLFLEVLSGTENIVNYISSLISLLRKNYLKLSKKAGN
jgi:hypothetical protein